MTFPIPTTCAKRLRDLEAMIDFNAMVEAQNPRLKRVAEALSGPRTGSD